MVCLWCLAVITFPSPNDFLLFLHCSSSPQETRHFPYPNIFLIFFLRSSSHEVTRYFPYPNIFVLSPSLFFFSSGGQIFLFSKYSPPFLLCSSSPPLTKYFPLFPSPWRESSLTRSTFNLYLSYAGTFLMAESTYSV